MIKLVPAKCPNCGAQLELDDNLKRTECKFCRTTIIVDEAIQKYQVELTGKVKITKDYTDKIETAKKYMKLERYDNANRVIDDVLEEDELNLEAKKVLVELIGIEIDKQDTETENDIIVGDLSLKKNKIIKELHEIEVLDEKKVYKSFIEETNKKYQALFSRIEETVNKKNSLIDKCNSYCNYNYKKLIRLLRALGYSEKKYGKNFGIISSIACWNDGMIRDDYRPFNPKITAIKTNYIWIFHDSNINPNDETYDLKKFTNYGFEKEELSFNEQIAIVEKLLDEEKNKNSKSIFSKLFG